MYFPALSDCWSKVSVYCLLVLASFSQAISAERTLAEGTVYQTLENEARLQNTPAPRPPSGVPGLTPEEQAWLDARGSLKVMNLMTFPPFSFNIDGQPRGYTVDYMTLMGERLGVPILFVSNRPWHEYLELLKKGQLDVIPHIAITEDRRSFIDFTHFNHIEYISGAAVNKRSGIRTLADLKGKVVAVTNKTFLHTWMSKTYPDQALLLTSSTKDAVFAVAAGRADAVIGSVPALNYYIAKDWLSNVSISRIEGFNLPEKTRLPMGVAKGNQILLSILEKTRASISYAEEAALKQQWMREEVSPQSVSNLTQKERDYLNNKRVLSMCVDPAWMPLEAYQDGHHTGIAADFIDKFRQSLNIPIEVVPTRSWAETLKVGMQGQCDFFSLIMTNAERKNWLSFTQPYIKTPLVFATNIEAPYVSNIATLKGKKIGIVRNYAFRKTLEREYPDLKFIDVEDITDGLEQVREGRLFAYADSLISIGYWIQHQYNGTLKVSGEFDAAWGLGIAVQKNNPILKGIFDKVIRQVSPGERQEIINKWISINYQKGTDWKITLVSIAAVVLFFSALLLWYRRVNSKLRHEITLRIKAEENALRMAQTDPLTGLLNRHASERLLDTEMARFRRKRHPVSILIMDIDHFKNINDTYGHSKGDEVLQSFSDRLSIVLRTSDHLIRWGGEEFLVLAPDTELAQAMKLAEKLRQTTDDMKLSGLPHISISIGVAQLQTGQNFSQWYEEADKALYKAKQNGRNRVCS